jgi:tetratricopeptide (TPR) repeat protein
MYILAALAAVSATPAAPVQQSPSRIERLNQAFREHVRGLGPEHARAAELIEQSWPAYSAEQPESFVPDALARLYPAFAEALAAFDYDRHKQAARLLEPLAAHADPYLAATARYFHVRLLVERGLLEEAEADLQDLPAQRDELAAHTPYAPHLWLILAHCQAGNLRYEDAAQTLQALLAEFPDAGEAVSAAARQMLLELAGRRAGSLEQVADLMAYSAARLDFADLSARLRGRQDDIVTLLDRLIAEARTLEDLQSAGSGQPRSTQRGEDQPRAGAQESVLPGTEAGQMGELRDVPRGTPGEAWGQLPPAERERILQSLRGRFPSRYRQLVEQYYRSLAEEQ